MDKRVLPADWGDLKEIIMYGYGAIGQACLSSILKDFSVPYIIDMDEHKQGRKIGGINIVSLEVGLRQIAGRKIIVSTGGRSYLTIAKVLKEKGLNEYEDFCNIEYFITEWYWQYKQKNCLMEIHTALTMQCTLKCKNCNMFVPHYSEKLVYPLQTLQDEFDLLFSKVDYVFCITLLGGEPLLYPQITEFVQYLFDNYKENIGTIKIITNGTIVPKEEFFSIMKDYPVWISISDYTNQVQYAGQLNKFIEKIKQYSLEYTVTKMETWNDFYFPERQIKIDNNKCAAHMKECSPIFHGYNDKKIYYCHVAWSAEKMGKFKLSESDYVDLTEINDNESRHHIAEHCLGIVDGGYISFCQFCGGCGKDNTSCVIAGEQIK